MPLFKRKGKVPPRNIEAGATTISVKDLNDTDKETGAIKLNLGDNKLVFEDGVWTSGVQKMPYFLVYFNRYVFETEYGNLYCNPYFG